MLSPACSRLVAERVDIAHRVDAGLNGIVVGVNRLPAGWFARMSLDQQAAGVKPHDLRVGPRGEPLADVGMWNRVQRFPTAAS
jgi:hypothetical protein